MKILVVDDEKFNIAVVKNILEREFPSLEKVYCLDPREVIDIIGRESIDVILLDIVMPHMDGIEVLKQIRLNSKFRDIQIIMLTSLNDKESFKQCFEYGAKDFIAKPIDIVEFDSRLKAALLNRKNFLAMRELLLQMQEQNNELAKLNSQLEETRFHMIQKEKLASIGELAAGVAHEINNPMGYITSNLDTLSKYIQKITNAYNDIKQVLAEGTIDLESQKKLDTIDSKYKISFILEDTVDLLAESKEGASKVSKIVKSLRNFARGGQEEEKMSYLFTEIMDEVLMITRNETKYAAHIEEAYEETLEVFCNKLQVQQVLINIIVNAAHAIKKEEQKAFGVIKISASQDEKHVIIEISDNGSGISEKNLIKIFDPFFTTKAVGSGTGLGLSISYDLIHNKHGGEIFATSIEGEGTTFTIKLPKNLEESGEFNA